MPVKKKSKAKQIQTAKQKVKQIVNVTVGDVKATRRPRAAAAIPASFNRPPINLSLSTQSYQPPAQNYTNEYNTLLRLLTDERKTALQSIPILAPNTIPLTTNAQRNELLSKKQKITPFTDLIKSSNEILKNVVNVETYDDPLTNENMFKNSGRLAQNLAPKLPVTNFDYSDINNYDMENIDERKALEKEIEIEIPDSNKRKKATQKEKLVEDTNNLIKFYNLEINDNKPLVKPSMSKKIINEQKKQITDLINERALKVSKMKVQNI